MASGRDMIRPFTGDGDVVAWITKVKLVARLQKIKDLASFLPLFLEGDALALYLQLSEEQQASASTVEAKLKEAFTDGTFKAFSKLSQKRWEGEPVDVFVTELKKLGSLAGFTGDGLDRIVRLAFVNGLPTRVSCELQQVPDVMEVQLSDLITRARIMTSNEQVNVVASVRSGVETGGQHNNNNSPAGSRFKGACFRCGGPHMARFCTERKEIVCFKCGEEGHLARHCHKNQNQGNEWRAAGAPVASRHQ